MATNRPKLKFLKGSTYTFDVSAAALATHPFKFTADSGSTEYTTGVTLTGTQGQAGASLSITVSDSAPVNLNYFCGTHGMGMGNHIVVRSGDAFDSDGEFFSVYRSHLNVTAAAGTLYTGGSGTVYFMAVDENVPATNDSAFLTDSNINVAIDIDHQYGGGYGKVYNITAAPAKWYGAIGVVAGGYTENPTTVQNVMQYFNIGSPGNAQDFGDLTQARVSMGAVSNGTRAVFGGGFNGMTSYYNTIDYVTTATTGNAQNFGNMFDTKAGHDGASDGTKGIFAGGFRTGDWEKDEIDVITIATTGNATDFGNLTEKRAWITGWNNATRAVFAGGDPAGSTKTNVMDYVTIATPGNAIDFGDMTDTWSNAAGAGDATYALFAGGKRTNSSHPNGWTENIDYITVATTGNATTFGGDLIRFKSNASGCADGTSACFSGGSSRISGTNLRLAEIDIVVVATPGNATDFGDLLAGYESTAATSGAAA